MSTIEGIEVSCDAPLCETRCYSTPRHSLPLDWYISDALDLCAAHVPQSVERPAPAAAPTAGTSSTEPIAFALSADDAVWVADALERYVTATGRARGVLRRLNAEIEDYARSLA